MAGIIIADTIQSGGSLIRLNSASQTVATINAAGIYANTGNLLIASNGTIGVASITNTAITGTMTQAQIGNGVAGTGPAFRAFLNSNQSVSTGVSVKVQLNAGPVPATPAPICACVIVPVIAVLVMDATPIVPLAAISKLPVLA